MIINPYAFAGAIYDADSQAWFTAVEAVSSITTANKTAVNAFVVGCKADGIWTAIKSCCLLCAANDLTGALVPLVGAAPTNNNFVSGDYSRTTGLVGDGSTKYLNVNRDEIADPQNNCHCATWINAQNSINGRFYIGSSARYRLGYSTSLLSVMRNRTSSSDTAGMATGLIGMSRSNGSGFVIRVGAANETKTRASTSYVTAPISIFGSAGGTLVNARLSFYSIGESIDLALLDARLTTLMAALT